MRFKCFLLLLIVLVTQSAWADQTKNYNIGPWKYTSYVESWPNYYSGEATYDHASEQSANNSAIAYINASTSATCSTFSYAWVDDWSSITYGDSLYGVHTEISARRYPRATGGAWSTMPDYTIGCAPHTKDYMVIKSRELTCPTGYSPSNGVCVAPDNTPKADNSDCPKCDAAFLNQSNPIHGGLGYKAQTENDYSSSSSALNFNRFYISASHREPSLLGKNWRHTYDRSLSYVENTAASLTTAVLNRPDSGRQYFKLVNSVWVPEAGYTERLEHLAGGGWRYTDNGDNKETYSEAGQLLSTEDRNGRVLTLQYVLDQLDAVVDEAGRSLTFAYQHFPALTDSRKTRLTTVGLPDGQLIKFQYDANGMLERAIYPDATPADSTDNPFRRYTYGDGTSMPTHSLTGLFDERGIQYASWQYTSTGKAISSEHGAPGSGIDKVSFVFNADGSTAVTNPYSQSRNYTFTAINGTQKITSMSSACPACGVNFAARTYDANGKTDIETDFAGVTTDTDYNSRGLLTQRIESANQVATKRITQTDWHATFNVPTEKRVINASVVPNVLVAKTKYAYNSRGQMTASCQIDPINPTAMSYVCGSSTNAPLGVRQNATTYCEQAGVTAGTCPLVGLVISSNGPRNDATDVIDVSTFTYYQTDDTTHRKGDLWKFTNALGHTTEYLAYDGAGRVLRMKDANNVITDMEYNARGWLTARKIRGLDDTDEFFDDAITRLSYDAAGQVTKVTGDDGHLMGDYINFTYDAAHRLTGISDPLGNSITYKPDNTGNHEEEVTRDPDGNVKRILTNTFDSLGRLLTSKNAANATIAALTYDAIDNLNTNTDGLSRVTDQDVDPLNRLIQTIQNVGGIAAKTEFQYDARDNLTKVIDPKTKHTNYSYDGLNNLTQLSSPDTGTTNYLYDSAGNRTKQTDANAAASNKPANYTYDALNRLTQVSYTNASTLTSTYNYDSDNTAYCEVTERFNKGRLTSITDPSGNTYYCYDRFGHMTRKRVDNNGVVSTILFTYTRGGRLSNITYPSGMKIGYSRDKANRVFQVSVTQGGTTKIFANNMTYYPFGPLSRIEFPAASSGGGTLQMTNPDAGSSLTLEPDMEANLAPDPDPCPGFCDPQYPVVQTRVYDQDYAVQSIGGLNYGVNVQGNITTILDSEGGNNFEYDNLDRLTKIKKNDNGTLSDVFTFAYDATGNRLSKKIGTAAAVNNTYDPNNHRLTAVGSTSRLLDNNGNTTKIASNKLFTYDARNRMVAFTSTPARTYQYNAKGERVRKYSSNTDAHYMFGESGQLLVQEKTFNEMTTTQEIIWLDDMPIGVNQDGELHGILTDHLNAPRAIFEIATQDYVWRWDMADNAFGDITNAVQEDADANGVTFTFDLRFPGQLFDAESGLHYNYFRDYEPSTGRYVQSDPIGLDGGISTYSYVASSPINYSDSMGLFDPTPSKLPITKPPVTNPPVTRPPLTPVPGKAPPGIGRGNPIIPILELCAANPILCGIAMAAYSSDMGADPREMPEGEWDCGPKNNDGNGKRCTKASSWQLKQAGITDAHGLKTEWGAVPNSRFDICACTDGSIVIKAQGACGIPGAGIDTDLNWK